MNSSLASCNYADKRVPKPVIVESLDPDPTVRTEICNNFYDRGFAIVRFDDIEPTTANMAELAQAIGLGVAYNQQQDTNFGSVIYSDEGYNLVGGYLPNPADKSTHPGVSTNRRQEVHSDGTRHPIGRIKTSTLLCVTPGNVGGESVVFNSVAAFATLSREFPPGIHALMHEESMVRTSELPSIPDTIGPAFALAGNELISRFSLDRPIRWQAHLVPNLNEAVDRMREMAKRGSPFYAEFSLKGGDALFLANDRIAHGRHEYKNGDTPRIMWRGFYETRPSFGLGSG